MMSKACVSVDKHEINRGIRLTNNGVIDYISFVLPNRTGQFQEDLYPEFESIEPSSNYEEWATGVDKPVKLMRLSATVAAETGVKKANFAAKLAGKPTPAATASSSGSSDETAALRAEIERLKAAGANSVSHDLNLNSEPKIGYSNIRGLAAPIRYILYFCGVKFEDKMYAYGPAPEFSRDDWFNEKFNLGLDHPNLPYLIDEGVKLTETVAIMKYICHKWKPELLGRNPVELGNIEMMFSHVLALKAKSTGPLYGGVEKNDL